MKRTFAILLSVGAMGLAGPMALTISLAAPSLAQARNVLTYGKDLFDKGKYTDALVTFRSALMTNPNEWQLWYYVGACEFKLKKYEQAIGSFNRYFLLSEEKSRDQAAAYYYLSFCDFELGQYSEALDAMEKHFAVYKHLGRAPDPTAWALLGRCRVMTGKYEEAIEPLKKAALKSEPNSANYYFLALAQLRAGKRDDASASLKMGLKINPDDERIKTLLKEDFQDAKADSKTDSK